MNEADTRANLVDPKLVAAGWGQLEGSHIRREVSITQGRIIPSGGRGSKRSKPVISDYVLEYRGRKLAAVEAVEAKKESLSYSEGVRQAKDYASRLQCRIGYATNGHEIYQIDLLTGKEALVEQFLSPAELWQLTYGDAAPDYTSAWREAFAKIPFEVKGDWQPRYYQENAIHNTLEAIAAGQQRILLTLATGTGKTCIAFQVAWKLFHSRWSLQAQKNPGEAKKRPRILFLADRNILANQAFNDFGPFVEDAIVRIEPSEIKKKGAVPKNASVFFTIFQTFMSPSTGSGTTLPPLPHEPGSGTTLPSLPLTLEPPPQPVTLEPVPEPVEGANGYTYILQCADDSFYVGSTRNLEHRLEQHRSGDGAKHTKTRLPVNLVYYETFERIEQAFAREKQIQKWNRAKKFALIAGDIERLKALSAASPPEPTERSVPEPAEGCFGDYPSDFFDFIIIDECHRGGANDESTWRAILDYFAPAVQLGLTATPKRTHNTDTYDYFGEPVYSYTLKEGINDGFLTPFKVLPIVGTLDEYVYTPGDGMVVTGEPEPGRVYKESDFNRIITIPQREQMRVRYWMDRCKPSEKTIVFCATQAHAGMVRDFVTQYAVEKGWTTNSNYCVRVTANDGAAGDNDLKIFQDNEKTIPTVLTTSRKLSTGVDARNVRNIVLMRPCNNMIEFKQIIGRGTRLYEGKDYFTVYDFVKAYYNFADPEWDGEPLEPEEPKEAQEKTAAPDSDEEDKEAASGDDDNEPRPEKITITLSDGKTRQIKHISSTLYWSPEGKPISAREFVERMFDDLPQLFGNEDQLREIWSDPTTREKLLSDLSEAGYDAEKLDSMKELIDARDSDVYDVLAFVAYAVETRTRLERVQQAKPAIAREFRDYKQQEFIDFILDKYVADGVQELAATKMRTLVELKYNTISDAAVEFGSAALIRDTFVGFQKHLYAE